jgi:hypothetical protein
MECHSVSQTILVPPRFPDCPSSVIMIDSQRPVAPARHTQKRIASDSVHKLSRALCPELREFILLTVLIETGDERHRFIHCGNKPLSSTTSASVSAMAA